MKQGLLPLLALPPLAGATISAQQQPPTPQTVPPPDATFRTDINMVEVHAVVSPALHRRTPGRH